MTTTPQLPSRTVQVAVWRPVPLAVAAQKLSVVGAAGVAVPGRRVEVTENGRNSKSVISSCATPRRYASTCDSRATPTKIGFPGVPVAVTRMVPRRPLRKSQSGVSVPKSRLSETSALVGVVSVFAPEA